ncbi:MAG: serine/threonine-protein phosphatase [Planctomycetes bacterium]|nr:serine/threonine-protein phosphatase [Planctomycetota bacterium]
MTYRPTIVIQKNACEQLHQDRLSDELMCCWPNGMPPVFKTEKAGDCDAALLFAQDESELAQILPILLAYHATNTVVLICCDDTTNYVDLFSDLDVTVLAYDASPTSIASVLYGLLQRNTELSLLRGQAGLMRTLHNTLQEEYDILQEELEVAATIQQEFMSTELQNMHGISCTSLWRPASVVSGDMYDMTQVDDDHIAFFIADAIGHGISAAMLAMMLTRTIGAHRYDSQTGNITQPAEMLNYLNTALLARTGDHARFATAAYGLLNCKTNILTIAGAGHPPALLSRFGGDPTALESKGPLLGVFETDDFPQVTLQLAAGDTLLLYSDGFEEALGNEECTEGEFPTYLHSMHEFCIASGSNVINDINTYLDHSIANSANDDLTMICLQAKPTPVTLGLAA